MGSSKSEAPFHHCSGRQKNTLSSLLITQDPNNSCWTGHQLKQRAESPTPFFIRGTNIVIRLALHVQDRLQQCKGVSNPRKKLGWNPLVQAHKPLKRHLCILPLNTRENCDLHILHKLRMSLSLDKYTTVKPHLLTIRHSVFQSLWLPVVTGYWPLGVTSIIVTTKEFTSIPLPVEVLQLLKRKHTNDCSPESCYFPKTTHPY